MYHSITFGDKNTWDDWHLVPKSRPVFRPPGVKEKYIDILGGDGAIDCTESLTGYPLFKNREGSFEFYVMNDYIEWQETYSMICNYLHGRKMRAVLEDDSEYYYEGRFKVNSWKSDKSYSSITIDYSVAPYKRRIEQTVVHISAVSESVTKTISNDIYGAAPSCPVFDVNTIKDIPAAVTFVNPTLGLNLSGTLSCGRHQIPEFVFYGNSVRVTVAGNTDLLTLDDSSGEAILDNSGSQINCHPSADVDIYCEYGGL